MGCAPLPGLTDRARDAEQAGQGKWCPVPIDLPEVAVFASGKYASDWDAAGKPTAWVEYTDADLQRMAENDAHLRATGQPLPYLKPAHDAAPVPGFVGQLRFRAGKLYAAIEKCADWVAEQVKAGVRPWRSAEIALADAVNFKGVTGPVFKGLALLNTHPRVKTLDSSVYAETRFAEPASAGSTYVTTFEEVGQMPSAEQVLAALKAVGGDQKLLQKVLDALGLGSGDATADPAEPAAAAPAASPEMMGEIVALKATNALLSARLEDEDRRRKADIAAARKQRIAEFGERVSLDYGAARAKQAMDVVAARAVSLPVLETFDERGADRLDAIFGEVKSLMGPATVKRTAGAVTNVMLESSVTNAGEFSEESAKANIFAEATPQERSFLKSPDGAGLLAIAIKRRKEEHAKNKESV